MIQMLTLTRGTSLTRMVLRFQNSQHVINLNCKIVGAAMYGKKQTVKKMAMNELPAKLREDYWRIFDHMDADGNGIISAKEMQAGLNLSDAQLVSALPCP